MKIGIRDWAIEMEKDSGTFERERTASYSNPMWGEVN